MAMANQVDPVQVDPVQPAAPVQPNIYQGLVAPEAPFRERPRTYVHHLTTNPLDILLRDTGFNPPPVDHTVDPFDILLRDTGFNPAPANPPAVGPPADTPVEQPALGPFTLDPSKTMPIEQVEEAKPASGGEDDNLPPPPTNLIRRATKRKAPRITMPKKKRCKTGKGGAKTK
jgi:hypothetical protein